MQKNFWQTALDQANVHLDGTFVTSSGPFGMDFSHQMRKATKFIEVDAIYCIQNLPHFAIFQQSNYDKGVVLDKYAALWNQCMCAALVVVTPDFMRIFSLAKSVVSTETDEFDNLCLIREVAIDEANSEFGKFVFGAKSGRIWRENTGSFNFRKRVDCVLLENLKSACKKLENSTLAKEEAKAILLQTLFIALLEDRGIILQDYFRRVSDNCAQNFLELLQSGNSTFLRNLFKDLNNDVCGDLFLTPCSFELTDKPKELPPEYMNLLADFRLGKKELSSGKLRLFGYDFRFVPVELISSVCDQFLTETSDEKICSGVFHASVPLAEVTINSAWKYLSNESKKNGVFLDPACGSGNFLVRCFQQLCEYYKQSLNTNEVPWSEIRKIVNRLHGRDLNSSAVRISVFLLYVAMLDESLTKEIKEVQAEGCASPALWNKTLIVKDFFMEPTENLKVDVILGSPPWSASVELESSALDWCAENNYEAPNKLIAWPFVWKAVEHLNENGLIALLLPATEFLYNTNMLVNYGHPLYLNVELKRIVDFSDFRDQIFECSKRPVALLTFSPKKKPVDDYKFEFWMPKAEQNPKFARFSNINHIDKSELWLSFVIQYKLAFKQYAWMRKPERKLFAYLDQFRKLSGKIGLTEQIADSDSKKIKKWVMGRGFETRRKDKKNKTVPKSLRKMVNQRYLDTKHFEPFSIQANSLQKFSWNELSDFGFGEVYSGSRVLVSMGIRPNTNRLCVDYVEESFVNKGQIIGIKNLAGQSDQTKLLAGLLSSRLATWFFFHCSGSFGVSDPVISQTELLEFPFPMPEELHNENQSSIAAKKIIGLVDRQFRNKKSNDFSANFDENKFFKKIDQLTYQYFCLSEKHIILIEDAVKYTIPSIHPITSSTKLLWMESNYDQRSKYAEQLKKCLDEWFEEGTSVSVTTVGKNEDITILKISLCNSNEQIEYNENDNLDFMENLVNMMRSSDSENGQQDLLGLKIFNGNDLFIIKPLFRRHWLESSAIGDADEIVDELQESSIQALLNEGSIETQQ